MIRKQVLARLQVFGSCHKKEYFKAGVRRNLWALSFCVVITTSPAEAQAIFYDLQKLVISDSPIRFAASKSQLIVH